HPRQDSLRKGSRLRGKIDRSEEILGRLFIQVDVGESRQQFQLARLWGIQDARRRPRRFSQIEGVDKVRGPGGRESWKSNNLARRRPGGFRSARSDERPGFVLLVEAYDGRLRRRQGRSDG